MRIFQWAPINRLQRIFLPIEIRADVLNDVCNKMENYETIRKIPGKT